MPRTHTRGYNSLAPPMEQSIANETLIAAAPELLQAVRLALDYYRSYGTLKYNAAEVEHTLEQALAKAEGRT